MRVDTAKPHPIPHLPQPLTTPVPPRPALALFPTISTSPLGCLTPSDHPGQGQAASDCPRPPSPLPRSLQLLPVHPEYDV